MPQEVLHRVFHSMGIAVHCTLVGVTKENANERVAEAERIFNAYDTRFSRFKETSELHRLNTSAGVPQKVSIEMFQVLKKCVALAKETDGVFDPSVGSILASYGYGLPANFTLPDPIPTYESIIFNERELEITLAPGQVLEPASIVKSMAIDNVAQAFHGIPGFMINAGGDIVTQGAFENGQLWNIAIQDPRDPRAILTAIGVQNAGIATSGIYQTHGEHKGKQWHHLINMQRGDSAHGIMSATVVAPTCAQADTEATLAILLGPSLGIMRLEQSSFPYFLILDDGTIQKNAAFTALEIPIETLIP